MLSRGAQPDLEFQSSRARALGNRPARHFAAPPDEITTLAFLPLPPVARAIR